MKLSDVVSAMHLPIFAEVPLVIFMGIFVGVTLHLLSSREKFARIGALPLEDELAPARRKRP